MSDCNCPAHQLQRMGGQFDPEYLREAHDYATQPIELDHEHDPEPFFYLGGRAEQCRGCGAILSDTPDAHEEGSPLHEEPFPVSMWPPSFPGPPLGLHPSARPDYGLTLAFYAMLVEEGPPEEYVDYLRDPFPE